MAFPLSYSSESNVEIRKLSNFSIKSLISCSISGIRLSSSSSYAISIRVIISSYAVCKPSALSTMLFKSFTSFISALALSASSQKSGASILRSNSSIRSFFVSNPRESLTSFNGISYAPSAVLNSSN